MPEQRTALSPYERQYLLLLDVQAAQDHALRQSGLFDKAYGSLDHIDRYGLGPIPVQARLARHTWQTDGTLRQTDMISFYNLLLDGDGRPHLRETTVAIGTAVNGNLFPHDSYSYEEAAAVAAMLDDLDARRSQDLPALTADCTSLCAPDDQPRDPPTYYSTTPYVG